MESPTLVLNRNLQVMPTATPEIRKRSERDGSGGAAEQLDAVQGERIDQGDGYAKGNAADPEQQRSEQGLTEELICKQGKVGGQPDEWPAP